MNKTAPPHTIIKQAASNIAKSIGASNTVKIYSKQKETFEKIISVLSKVIIYTMLPFYIFIIFLITSITSIIRYIYKGLIFGIKGLGILIKYFWKIIITLMIGIKTVAVGIGRSISHFAISAKKLFPKTTKVLKRLIVAVEKGILLLLIPPLFIFLLVIILLSKIFPFIYKWIAYGITALRVMLTFIGERGVADGSDLDKTIEFSGFAYDSEKDIFYSTMNPWQRKFGYCRLYDEAAALWGMIVDCEPIYFEYNGKQWLIEFWKGQYDLTTGCEIGVYTTEGPTLDIPGVFNGTFYNSGDNEDRLQMSFRLKKENKTLFIREDEHWWLTGFLLGEFSKPSELTMQIKITLKDRIMCNLFVKGLKNAGYSDSEIIRNGNEVGFNFGKPKTPQPFTRMKITDWVIQKKNKRMCKKYQEITGTSIGMQEKLMAIQEKAPKLYTKIINIGKSQNLYNKVRSINNYMK